MDILGSDEMLAVLETGEAAKDHLLGMCYEFCLQSIRGKRTMDALRGHAILVPIEEAQGRVINICRCLVHLLGGVWPDAQNPTSAKDVLDFMQGKASGVERRLRNCLSKTESFWWESYQDVLRCGSQGVLLAPNLDRLRTIVEPDAPQDAETWVPPELVKEALKLTQSLDGKLRAVELGPVVSQLQNLCKATIRKVVASAGHDVPAGLADALLEAAIVFNQVPGFETSKLQLEEWLRQNRSQVALKDLLKLMDVASGLDADLNYEVALKLLQKIGLEELSDDDMDSLRSVAGSYLVHIAEFVTEKASDLVSVGHFAAPVPSWQLQDLDVFRVEA